MGSTRSKASFIHTVSVMAISATAFVALPAVAQDDVGGDESETDNVIIVTGSNIRSRDYDAPSPIQTLDAAALENTGTVRLQDVFKGITSNSGSQTSNRQNALQGVSQFSLRGLGLGSTLTLVNGRRAGLSPVSDDTGQLFTDSNQFPVNMIERIEVLTDGSSATYGSEAVAGVVNIITRKNFEGVELTGEYRDSTHESYQLGAAVGSKFDRGSFQLFLNYYKQSGNFRGDFDFIRERDAINLSDPDFDNGGIFNSGTGSPGRFDLALDNGDGTFSRTGNTLADPDCVAAGGILRGEACRYNFIDQRRLIAEEERFQAFTQFEYDVSDKLNLFGEVSFSRNEVRDALGGAVLRVTTQDGGFLVPEDHPFNFFTSDGAGGITYAGPDAFAADPTLAAVPLIFRGRPLGSAFDGENSEDIVTVFDNLRFVGGFDYEVNDSWVLSGSYQYSDNSYSRQQPRDFGAAEFQAAILSGAWNPFGTAVVSPNLVSPIDGVSTAGNTAEDLSLFSFTINEVGGVTQQVAEIILSGDTGISLAGSDTIAVALGAQYRKLGFEFTPDGRRQSGNNGRGETEAAIPLTTQDVYAFFAEAAVPVTDRVEAQLAIRYEDYGAQGGSTVDPKISARFEATDFLSFRASYGTSFQAPSIRQVSGAVGSAGVTDPLDPAGGNFNVTVFTSGSPDLTSLSAENFNLGVVVNTGDFRLSADYFDYQLENLILPGGDPQSIIDADPNGPAVLRDAVGQLNAVFTGFENRGDASVSGLDINAAYSPDWFGDVDLSLFSSATIITKFRSTEFAGLDGNGDLKGSRNFANAFGSTPDFKLNLGATVSTGAHALNVTARHVGSYTDDQSGNPIDSQTTVDLRYSIALDILGGETELNVGAVNIFDKDPPQIDARPLFDTEVHDPRGRQIYAGIKHAF